MMVRKFLVLPILAMFTVILGACSTGGASEVEEGTEDTYKVLLLIPGNLGDKSFFDSANNGLKMIAEELDAETKVIEMGTDETQWEPNLLDASEGDWDVIISGNAASEMMNEIAVEYPEKRYINFDNSGAGVVENVYSVSYGTNEGSFMAGAMAGLVTQSDLPLANEDNTIGFLGGMDIPGINDFLVGYIQGAQYVNPEVNVIATYAGSFTDPANGKELSMIQYDSGADISFNVAGQTGLGLIDAAHEKDGYAIGVDSDQAMLYAETEPEKAEKILSSAVKYIDLTLLNAVKEAEEGNLAFGEHQLLGVEDGAVGLAKNEYYDQLPEDIQAELEQIEAQISSGEIEVLSGFDMTTEEIVEMRSAVTPK